MRANQKTHSKASKVEYLSMYLMNPALPIGGFRGRRGRGWGPQSPRASPSGSKWDDLQGSLGARFLLLWTLQTAKSNRMQLKMPRSASKTRPKAMPTTLPIFQYSLMHAVSPSTRHCSSDSQHPIRTHTENTKSPIVISDMRRRDRSQVYRSRPSRFPRG